MQRSTRRFALVSICVAAVLGAGALVVLDGFEQPSAAATPPQRAEPKAEAPKPKAPPDMPPMAEPTDLPEAPINPVPY
ncbi:hypothetical protein [Parvularcula dongshanensis]|uniref:Uncharacterized protein n=1 Tax=Parvularcula dongshanensis TaxID=1173995 RepID=A0A840I2H1_9PROT|nr:hypothetical protein [Parvularcula dongshanensis]MBB4658388.1 hypothetical protein [Parvularcula dongshanensis]